jgi:hypothetical protein
MCGTVEVGGFSCDGDYSAPGEHIV